MKTKAATGFAHGRLEKQNSHGRERTVAATS